MAENRIDMRKRCITLFLSILFSFSAITVAFSAVGTLNATAAEKDAASPAFDPFAEGASYSFVTYNNTNGLPTSEANAITQTGDGFMWIGSYGGLVRYDGNRFERMDSSLGISGVVCLFADKKDRLWIGSNDSGFAMLYQNELRRWGIEDGLKSLAIVRIIEDPKGTIYVGTKSGVIMIGDDMELVPLDDERIANQYIADMQLGSDGLIYCLSYEKDVFSLKDGEIVRYYPGDTLPASDITCMLPDKNHPGHIYFGSTDAGIYHCDMRGEPETVKMYADESMKAIESLTYIGDRMWICASDNVFALDGNEIKMLKGLPMNNKVYTIMADYEGNYWLTSNRQGVLKITPNRFVDLYYDYQLPEAVVNTTCVYDDKLFIGTDSGLTVIDKNGVLDKLKLKNTVYLYGKIYTDLLDMLKEERIRSLIKDSRDRMWISTFRGFGLLCYDHGNITSYGTYNDLISDTIRTVCEMKDGSIAVATNDGVSVIRNDEVVESYGKDDGIENTVILTIAEGRDGEILAGSNGGGLYIIGKDGIRTLRIADGLTSDTILRVKPDHQRDIVWIITSNSIAYMTPDDEITTISAFPYANNFDFVQNSKDEMWILSSNGIYVTATEDMLDGDNIAPAHYSIANGLSCTATANSFSGLNDNGDFYLSGNTGVVKMNIESGFEINTDCKSSVPFVEVDNALRYPDEKGNFTIPANTKRLTIYAEVFNYSLMTPLVSYCLEGFSDDFVTVTRSQLMPIVYTNLHGGDYRFVMKVMDPRTKSVKTISVEIEKEKAFYEQIWFYIAIGAAFIVLLVSCLRAAYLKKIEKMEKKHREEVERERVASDMNTAGMIQEGMLPRVFPPFPDRKEFDLYAAMDPAREVGGDFYDFFMIDDDHLCTVIADVSGKGIPASLVMMATMIIIRNYAKMGKNPAEVLALANEQICANNSAEMFITAWLGVLEISTGKLTAASAGHEYPALMKANGQFALYRDKHGFVLGAMTGMRYKEYEIRLDPGSKLFVYTDGVPEASDINEELFGTERMIAALNEAVDLPPEGVLKKVREAVDAFVKDAEQFDDLTMLCLEYKGDPEIES